ncbi:site-specific DNA-methyltransferase [Macrococcus capreoli]|uniref:site-specific DNA-methyltransferase n=1 Tax=Macrococcus capreoli TaxID=2982690 RepID=UPI003EE4F8A6
MNKVPSSSPDLTQENIARLKELFPEILTDGEKIDFDKLKTVLGEEVEDEKERYSFNWHGKKAAILGAQQPSKGTLRPDKEKSKNFDTTENLYIEGDNLEVLKLLQKSYSNKIKMIYIDPPYNTGKDFVYKDNFRDGIDNYLEQTGQVDSDGNVLSTNSESNGRYHTDWLNMMYPRLKLARNLLTDDGVIFISIDDLEQEKLKILCNEIYGESNFLGNIIWKSRVKPVNIGEAKYRPQKEIEYILVYQKTNTQNKFLPLLTGSKRDYPYKFNGRKYRLATILKSNRGINFRSTMSFSLKEYSPPDGQRWQAGKEEIQYLYENNYIEFKNGTPFRRYFEDEETATYEPFYCYLPQERSSSSEVGKNELNNILGNQHGFDTVKPTQLIMTLIASITDNKNNEIILDFFSGSGTTAHAVFKQNSLDNGKRKVILVQLPEHTKKSKSISHFNNITEIGQERIRKAGELVKKELIEKNEKAGMLDEGLVDPEKLDIGFKALKLDKSNIREWNSDFEDIEDNLFAFEDVFVEGRTELDIVYEIMLKNGLELTYSVDEFEVGGKNIYDVAAGNLFICLNDEIDNNIAQAIIDKRNDYGIETSTVVFKDAGFKNDSDKLNVIEILKDSGYPEENILTI